jgi:hypothetical protein
MLLHANGEYSPNRPDDEPRPLVKVDYTDGQTVTLGWPLEWHDDQCPRKAGECDRCDCEELGFSWMWCDGCDWSLAGDRHAMTLWLAPPKGAQTTADDLT